MSDATTDRTLLRQKAYADSGNLRARQSLYDFKEPVVDWWSWVLGHVDWPGDAVVLDVGCGPGNYLEHVAGVGVDLSFGMAAEARRHAPTAVGDVCALPIASASVDRLLAPHMLYHAPDLDQATSELRRVLRPGGTALIVTNDPDHFGHLVEQLSAATGTPAPVRFADRFTLSNGAPVLRTGFDEVEIDHHRGEIIVPYVEPVVRYADSCRSLYELQLPAGVTWEESMERFAALVEQEIAAAGTWRTPTHSGVFVCR